eukprot:755299-Hanusia_phi.AAC.2
MPPPPSPPAAIASSESSATLKSSPRLSRALKVRSSCSQLSLTPRAGSPMNPERKSDMKRRQGGRVAWFPTPPSAARADLVEGAVRLHPAQHPPQLVHSWVPGPQLCHHRLLEVKWAERTGAVRPLTPAPHVRGDSGGH